MASQANQPISGFQGSWMNVPDVGHRDQVGVVGRLADVAGGEPGEPGTVGEQAVELLRGNQLRARLRVHVDELREQELDPVLGDRSANVVGGWA